MSKTTEKAADSNAVAAPELIFTVTPDQIADAIKAVGCAVTMLEQNGLPMVHSASHGVGFQVLWGNASSEAGKYIDFTLSCPLRVQEGALPEGLIAEWHRAKRFARLVQHGDMISLEMDVIVAGGVTPNHLAMTMQLWTQMMGQLFLYLRNFDAAKNAVDQGSVPAGEQERQQQQGLAQEAPVA
ncbi:YbjN domain-containing protein [Herbaspirillum robiniae]|uniref:YbjN domain-containing protein n=1 Tax=Herbaspirillum robiniae TaxID=2014887 RepID=A0A246WTQ1_9BURK|nr:YbjN domain-containing protein [Herbaspirillum robiniae]OWY30388.1 hypothetical protein CEJ42_05390 [Herbaspirillum robiniae]